VGLGPNKKEPERSLEGMFVFVSVFSLTMKHGMAWYSMIEEDMMEASKKQKQMDMEMRA